MVENTSTPSRAWNSKHVAMDLPDLKETYISFHLSRDPPVETRREKKTKSIGQTKEQLAEECFNTSGTNWKSSTQQNKMDGCCQRRMFLLKVKSLNKQVSRGSQSNILAHVISETGFFFTLMNDIHVYMYMVAVEMQ